jgi:hypothetical protein
MTARLIFNVHSGRAHFSAFNTVIAVTGLEPQLDFAILN